MEFRPEENLLYNPLLPKTCPWGSLTIWIKTRDFFFRRITPTEEGVSREGDTKVSIITGGTMKTTIRLRYEKVRPRKCHICGKPVPFHENADAVLAFSTNNAKLFCKVLDNRTRVHHALPKGKCPGDPKIVEANQGKTTHQAAASIRRTLKLFSAWGKYNYDRGTWLAEFFDDITS
ncbi:hypothetical protein HYW55_00535 [Candidatus Gottesmanbacteria bacterium]|nr:hypothetical protein [Candidatus Gottesmanbacteria bacterium]